MGLNIAKLCDTKVLQGVVPPPMNNPRHKYRTSPRPSCCATYHTLPATSRIPLLLPPSPLHSDLGDTQTTLAQTQTDLGVCQTDLGDIQTALTQALATIEAMQSCLSHYEKENGVRCRDGIDNDCDGLVDANDPDCQ